MKLIRLPHDIFNLDYSKIENLDGWGKQSVANLRYSINLKKVITFERFIFALGIRHIGLENAKIISKNLKSIKNFISLSKKNKFDELLNIDGIGETQISSIKNFFLSKTNLKVLNQLEKILEVKDSKNEKKDGLLRGKTFMFTGKLSNISRSEAKSLIEQNSGSIVSNVTKKLDYLVIDCLRYRSHPSHYNLDDVLILVNKIKPKKTILTNLNNDIDYNPNGSSNDIAGILSKNGRVLGMMPHPERVINNLHGRTDGLRFLTKSFEQIIG